MDVVKQDLDGLSLSRIDCRFATLVGEEEPVFEVWTGGTQGPSACKKKPKHLVDLQLAANLACLMLYESLYMLMPLQIRVQNPRMRPCRLGSGTAKGIRHQYIFPIRRTYRMLVLG